METAERTTEGASQLLHRLTSYGIYDPSDPDKVWEPPVDDPRVLRDLVVNDTDRLPWFYKRYAEELATVPLPRELPTAHVSAVGVLAGTAGVPAGDLDLPQLSRLLHLSAGVVRTTVRPYATWLFRAAGSAGGRFPLELYVAVPDGGPLPAGVHWYHPQDHALVRIGPPPAADRPAVIVTGVPWRTGWRYRERGFRHVYWDAGTMLSQLLAVAASAGIAPSLHTRFPDASIAELVGADGVHEWPVAVIGLGGDASSLRAGGPAARGAVDAVPVEFPLATAAQHAGALETWGPPMDPGPPVEVTDDPGTPLDAVVLARGSIRLLDPTRSLPAAQVRAALDAAMRAIDVPHFVAVHAVDGVEPGIYRWPDVSTPRRAGNLRDELYVLALEQGLAQDAAFVTIGATDVAALDDRGYREAQLQAGIVEGRLHLYAYALGAAACGMTFVDSEIASLLGEPLDGLLLTCVGVGEYRSATGGLPGAPTQVKTVTPRSS